MNNSRNTIFFNCILRNNSARNLSDTRNGGAVAIIQDAASTMSIERILFNKNVSDIGGVFWISFFDPTGNYSIRIIASTFYRNTATKLGGSFHNWL